MITSRTLLAMGLTLLACVPAFAQTQQPSRPERPYRGMFASGVDNSGQSLTANADLSGGYDDNILANATSSGSVQSQQEGSFAQFSGGLNYALNSGRGTLNAATGTSQRYYPSLQDPYFKTYNASLGGSLQVLAKPAISLHGSASYQPYTFLTAFPDAIDPPAGASSPPTVDYVPLAEQYMVYAGGVDLRQPVSRRTSFQMSYDYRAADRLDTSFWRQSGDATFLVGMTRDLSLRLGYRYTQAHYDNRLVELHRPDIGLDFLHALSLTRRTSFTFGVGTEATVYNGSARYRINGNATLIHEMGRSWSAVGRYERGTYFVDTLADPVYGDTASFTLGGLVTRRIQLQSGLSATVGQVGFGSERPFDSYRGTVSLSSALNRFMNVGVDYVYYKYVFDEDVVLDPGVAHNVNRQSIRAHVSFWAPIFNKARRPNASR